MPSPDQHQTKDFNVEDHSAATTKRKEEHIRICLQEQVDSTNISTGLEHYHFVHNALPEVHFDSIDLSTIWQGYKLDAPLLVSSMTGGTSEAGKINERLAEAAESFGWCLALGSMRAALEKEELAQTFNMRAIAPSIPIIANIGAVQLNYGYGIEQCERAVDLAQASALVLHLNSMQEIFQPEGDVDFSSLLPKIEMICRQLSVPMGIKEVGFGIDAVNARRLADAGVAFIDVAGAGGTSWIQVEKYRSADGLRRVAAEAFGDWGTPTAACLRDIRLQKIETSVIASGGLKNGVDAAKALALGADLVGFGKALLPQAVQLTSKDDESLLHAQFARIAFEIKAVMFGIGVRDIEELQHTDRLVLR